MSLSSVPSETCAPIGGSPREDPCVINIPMEEDDIRVILLNEFNEVREMGFVFPPTLRRENVMSTIDLENCLFKIPYCNRFLPPRFQEILETIVAHLLEETLAMTTNQLKVCDKIYREKYDNGTSLFREGYIPSFIEHVLAIILEQESTLVRRCAKACIIARICIHQPEGTMELEFGTTYIWRKMLHSFPCPLLWDIYINSNGIDDDLDTIIEHNINEYSELQRVFLMSTRRIR